ncbi:MAG TPA: hypothetical protein VF897_20085, partial [Roseiflexaceae bacterium]
MIEGEPVYVDSEAAIRAFLADAPRVKAICGTYVVASSDLQMPEGYDVARSPGVVFALRGGTASSHAPLSNPFIQVRSYGADGRTAWAVDRAILASLHGRKFGAIKMALLNAPGQLVKEPATNWTYIFSTYRL